MGGGGGVLGMEVRMESVEGVATVGRDDVKKWKGRPWIGSGEGLAVGGSEIWEGEGGPGDGSKNGVGRRGSHSWTRQW
jgi:hypothetical protein